MKALNLSILCLYLIDNMQNSDITPSFVVNEVAEREPTFGLGVRGGFRTIRMENATIGKFTIQSEWSSSMLVSLLKGIMEVNFQVLLWNVCFYFFQGEAVTPSYANEVTKPKPTFGFGRIFLGGLQTSSTERATISKLNFTFFKTWVKSKSQSKCT